MSNVRRVMAGVLGLLVVCGAALLRLATAQTPNAATLKGLGIREAKRDVVYSTVDGFPNKLDIYLPLLESAGPAPAAVFIHGGGWIGGSKKSIGPGALQLVRHGFIVASLDYRLGPKYLWPAQIDDVKCAIRYLRAHAAEYHLDTHRIGVWGGSAGGHLVAMLGLAGPKAGFDAAEDYRNQSSQVEAVVDLFGPTDLTVPGIAENAYARQVIHQVFGVDAGQPSEVLRRASPVTYVTKKAPPFLIIHGDSDSLVPFSQSQELYDRLKAAGDSVTLVKVRRAGHGFVPTPPGSVISPSNPEIAAMVAAFFEKHLGQPTGAK